MKLTTCSIAMVSFLLGTPSLQAQDKAEPSLLDLFTLEAIATRFLQSGVSMARSFADITYDGLSADPLGSRYSLVGLVIRPDLESIAGAECSISTERLTLSGAPLASIERVRLTATLDETVIDYDCLPREIRPVIGMAGIEDIIVPRLRFDIEYHIPSGQVGTSMIADVADLVSISGYMDADYVSYRMDAETSEPGLRIDLDEMRLSIEDQGIWSRVEQIVPKEARSEDALAKLIEGVLTDALIRANGPLDPDLSPEQVRFVAQATDIASQFQDGPRRVILNMQPSRPIRLGPQEDTETKALFADLAPQLTTQPPELSETLPLDLLETAISGNLADADRLTIGTALASGIGAPRDRDLARDVLAPIADASPEAAVLMAELTEDPEEAYVYARTAAATGMGHALSLMDRLETEVTFQDLIRLQSTDEIDAQVYNSVGAMRGQALARLIGTRTPRSYERAYYWAVLAAAAGDRPSADLRDEVDEMMRVRGADAEWEPIASRISRAALETWIDRDLPNALLAE
ncbi:hypothetical protein AAD018_013390 [Aestuariibius insulae]|uniref:hypothetical protein n=1 Tax=Aestuariibius insulae TaxID=2058287 RepID=UPI00345EC79E